jgi:putative tributyrin esterase
MNESRVNFRTLERADPAISAEGLQFVTVKSPALRRRADVTLFAPPVTRGVHDLPIVTLLHGVYGSHWAWALKGRAHITATRLIAEGKLPPVALLMPSDGLSGDGSGYVPQNGMDAERWIMDDIPALARQLIDGCTERSPLLLAGLSMGGFGALRLAGKHRQRIAAAAGLSAITEVAQLAGFMEESMEGWSPLPADRSVLAALTGGSGSPPPLRIDCGLEDGLLDANRALHAALEQAAVGHLYAERPGGHDWAYWTRTLEDTLIFFGDVLQGRY